ncbi:MAG: Holliday junction branch migration protein RuvA [Bacteroidetes bacterium]|nr:Holliday junction branch migration protein RuvA [Bacteroidota bacterium]MCH8523228.1 Holliday junction branch migration protein RuvA [Balneolales bacterium]
MIAFLNGILAEKHPNKAIIDVSGVGYEAGISTQTFANLPHSGAEVRLLIYHHMTESEQRLFGFLDAAEKSLFELLITVKGVGPRLALTMLSGLPASEIAGSIARQDAVMLARTPGIGKKTAERLVLELKDKIGKGIESSGDSSLSASSIQPGPQSEAVSALESLGFKRSDAEKAVEAAINDGAPAETGELVRGALKRLYR